MLSGIPSALIAKTPVPPLGSLSSRKTNQWVWSVTGEAWQCLDRVDEEKVGE